MSFLFNALKKLIVFLFLTFGLNIGQSLACSCGHPSVEGAFNITPVIFKGKAKRIEKIPLSEIFELDSTSNLESRLDKDKFEWFTKREMIYRVQFEECIFFKGIKEKKSIAVYTSMSGASCGYRFSEEETYIVYSNYNNFFSNTLLRYDIKDIKPKSDIFWTNLCLRNTTAVEEEERAIKKEIEMRNSFFFKTFRSIKKTLRKAMRD